MRKHVVIAIPAYAGTVHLGTLRSLMADALRLVTRGDVLSIDDECGGAEISTLRAVMVAQFLAGKGTHLVMVDHDVCWEAGGLCRLIDAGVDCVAGVYPRRELPISYPVHFLGDGQTHDVVNGLVEVKAVPAGFLCMSRPMLERMTQAYADLSFKSSKTPHPVVDLFGNVHVDEMKLSEDLSFCHRWRALGGKVHIIPDMTMAHVGPHIFTGRLGELQECAA